MALIKLGDLELTSLLDGYFRLDGGAMFGIVPKTLWEKRAPADEKNRITLGMRPLLVRGNGTTMLIDAGIGDKMDAKSTAIYAIDRSRNLDHSLADAGLDANGIELVLASHFHFDHAGGFTTRDSSGTVCTAVSARALRGADGRVGRRHASARAESRKLPAGEFRSADERGGSGSRAR